MNDSHALGEDHSRSQIESLIRAAGRFVQPSDDLRPRILEAARLHCGDRRAEQKLGGFAIAVMLLLSFSSPAMQYVDVFRAHAAAPSATEIEYRAIKYGSQPEIGTHWGLTEAFTELRRSQASRLGLAHRTIK